jgi:penicillin-binding protein 1A
VSPLQAVRTTPPEGKAAPDAPAAPSPPAPSDSPTPQDSNGAPPPPERPPGPPAPPGRRPPEGRPRLRKLRMALVVLGLCALAFVSWIFGIMMAVASDLPQLEDRAQFAHAQNSVVLDTNGQKIATLTNTAGRILISSGEISPSMKEATVAIEDQRFYQHRGVDFMGIGRAVFQDVLHRGASQGGSTITEQFVKNALRAQGSRTVFQKLREAALAYQLERHWDKDKILTQYLNEIYFGEGAYGIESAARTFFGYAHPGCGQDGADTCASQLLPWESALLAGIISNPSGYDPRTQPDAAMARRNTVLQKMEEQGDITPEEYQLYSQKRLPRPGQINTPTEDSRAPYFTSWLRQQVVDKFGAGEAFGGGLQITSTLDLNLQQQVQDIAASHVAGLGPTASVVVLDNATGGVRAMIGGYDYSKQPFNLATQGHRQPGSAFKPFTLVTALEQGLSPDQVFTSAPQQIPYKAKVEAKDGGEKIVPDLFRVANYDDSYAGSSTITTATTHSDNSVYAQLGTQVGPANVAHTANDMGIDTNLSTGTEYSIGGHPFEPYNPALILGGLETGVSPLEMAHAYETLAVNGARVSGTMAAREGDPIGIEKVTNSAGDLVDTTNGDPGENDVTTKQVVPPGVAGTAKSILQTVVSEGTGTNASTGQYEWGKTGTTENNGDAWFVGATKDITVAVWVGFPDGVKPMETEYNGGPVDGGTIPALIWHDVVDAYDQEQSSRGRSPDTTSTTGYATTTTTPALTTTAPAPTTGTDSSSSSSSGSASSQQSAPSTSSGDAAAGGGSTSGAVGAG